MSLNEIEAAKATLNNELEYYVNLLGCREA